MRDDLFVRNVTPLSKLDDISFFASREVCKGLKSCLVIERFRSMGTPPNYELKIEKVPIRFNIEDVLSMVTW